MALSLQVLLMTLQNDPPTLDSTCTDGTKKSRYSSKFKEMVSACLKKEPSERCEVQPRCLADQLPVPLCSPLLIPCPFVGALFVCNLHETNNCSAVHRRWRQGMDPTPAAFQVIGEFLLFSV